MKQNLYMYSGVPGSPWAQMSKKRYGQFDLTSAISGATQDALGALEGGSTQIVPTTSDPLNVFGPSPGAQEPLGTIPTVGDQPPPEGAWYDFLPFVGDDNTAATTTATKPGGDLLSTVLKSSPLLILGILFFAMGKGKAKGGLMALLVAYLFLLRGTK